MYYRIEKNVPLEPRRRRDNKYNLRDMDVGDVKRARKPTTSQWCVERLGMKFETRKVEENLYEIKRVA